MSATTHPEPTYRPPTVADGADLWRLAAGSGGPDGEGGLDLNTPYAYLLWCRDFAATSVVAMDDDGELLGFVMGYLRPDEPHVLFVWQVTTTGAARGRGVARGMLDALAGRLGSRARWLEASVTSDNTASRRTFERFAADHSTDLVETPLFAAEDFPASGVPHDPEVLLRIGPW